ncbi:probable C-C chemokine receptor type 3 isoform X2 [Mugil cephalus]|nr:probable C-C chemokine receptor type 3 isoform X2 [Mugil cephalus]
MVFSTKFLIVLYSLVFILGFIGNGLVVCVLVKHRKQTNLTDICLFNLAISDLVFIFTLPFYSHFLSNNNWNFGEFMCRFLSGCHMSGFFSSIFFMVVMTLDRYMVIMHAHRFSPYRTMRTATILTVFVWIVSICVSMPSFVFTKLTNQSNSLACNFTPENDAWNTYKVLSTNILGLLVPLLVMVVCYSRIIPTLVNMRTVKRHRVVKLIISIVAIFFLFWTPYNITIFLLFLRSMDKIENGCTIDKNLRLSTVVTEAIAYSHCCLNPIIYAFVGQKFMRRALQLLKKWVPGPRRNFSESSYRKSSVVSRSSDVTTNFIM